MSERKIDEATMDNVEILAKLALTPQERQKAMDEMDIWRNHQASGQQ